VSQVVEFAVWEEVEGPRIVGNASELGVEPAQDVKPAAIAVGILNPECLLTEVDPAYPVWAVEIGAALLFAPIAFFNEVGFKCSASHGWYSLFEAECLSISFHNMLDMPSG